MDFTTKYWVIVIVLALVLLVGTGALSVWICKIYDTQKPPALPPGVSPFPDVIPDVEPPSVDPVSNNCYKWCSDGNVCPDVKPTTCQTDGDCFLKCTVPNAVTDYPKCVGGICIPPWRDHCISNFPTYPGTDSNDQPVQVADASNLKQCITKDDCNVCRDKPQGGDINCVYVDSGTTLTLQGDSGPFQVQSIPQGWYCLPERTGCDAHAGVATWTEQGWSCDCKWGNVMSGPECDILTACRNNETTPATQALQQLLVNCNDPSNPMCGQPWVPESNIDPTGCYDKTQGFNVAAPCGTANAAPNCVCQCDGTQQNSNKGFTYDLNNPLTCVLDPCNNTAWGRTLPGDAGYLLNAIPQMLHSLLVVSPVSNKYLSLQQQSLLTLSDSATDTKFVITEKGGLGAYRLQDYPYYTVLDGLATNAQGNQVGASEYFDPIYADGETWVLLPVQGTPFTRVDNLDTLLLYNPKGNRPAGAQFTDPAYRKDDRYLVYNISTSTFSLGSRSDPGLVLLQKVDAYSLLGDTKTQTQVKTVTQPMTNCACSGANSMASLSACFDANDNFVSIASLMSLDDKSKCASYRNVSSICDPYTIPNSVLTIQPGPESKLLCDLYNQDLQKMAVQAGTSSTNLLPFRSGFVPGLDYFYNPLTGDEELLSVCSPDPCTGKYGDAAFSLQNNSGYWDALRGQCQCTTVTDDPSKDFLHFPVDFLLDQWNKACKENPTSSACVCNHVTNPVCAVCQNACQAGSPCQQSPNYPCTTDGNMSCRTDPDTGGSKCVCMGNCIYQADNVCMEQIPPNGLCEGVEGLANACADASQTCKKMTKACYSCSSSVNSDGTPTGSCTCDSDICNTPNIYISYCTGSDETSCADTTSPYNITITTDGLGNQTITKNGGCVDVFMYPYEACPVLSTATSSTSTPTPAKQ